MSGIDRSQIWYPGPTRVFTAEELTRAGGDRQGRTLETTVMASYTLLSGAAIGVRTHSAGDRVTLGVRDSGPVLAPGAGDGVGPANSRRRLAQAFGAAATLSLESAAAGGCIARITFPLEAA